MTNAVASLLAQYRRGRSLREIAAAVGRNHSAVVALFNGEDAKGNRSLGLRTVDGSSLVVDVARELGVPKAKLASALLEDLGWTERG